MSVEGVVVLTRNGDRQECFQHPVTYEAGQASSTPLGEVQAFKLGADLRELYFNSGSSSAIKGIASGLADLKGASVEGESSKATSENLQRKVQLLEEELDAAEKNVKDTVEKYDQPSLIRLS